MTTTGSTSATTTTINPAGVDEKFLDRLRKVLALTTSPEEGEAQAAAEMLQRLLTEHNLSMADLEAKGGKKHGVREQGHDLGKAAFTWKLDLAEAIADHYFCHAVVDRSAKSVVFIGRPDNVESLQMLYAWVIDQIKRIASDERKQHQQGNGQHVDPLRWQVNFGLGAVERLRERLVGLRQEREAAAARHQPEAESTMALVVSRSSEVSDYLEAQYGYRVDGRKTKREREWDEKMRIQAEANEAARKAKAELLASDPKRYYELYPEETPEAKERQRIADEKWWKRYEAKERRNARRRTGSYRTRRIDWEKEEQAGQARSAGRSAASKVNLEPFLKEGERQPKGKLN